MSAPWVFLYDGHCRFCTAGAEHVRRLSRPGVLTLRDFQQPGVLDDYPQLDYARCMREAQLVSPEGRVFSGMEAIARAVMTRPVLGWLGWLYYIPGVRWLADTSYAWVAANRYRIFGRTQRACEDEACAVHLGPPRRDARPSGPALPPAPTKSIPPRA